MFTCDKTKFLTAGDIEQYTENIIFESNLDLTADILKLNHHGIQKGNEISNTENFIYSVNPKYAYFQFQFDSNPYNYDYSHVEQSIKNLSHFSNIYVTGVNDNIKFVIKDDVITPIVEKNKKTK